MPELPEVETVRRGFERVLLGRRIVDARLLRRDVLSVPGDPVRRFATSTGRSVRPERVRPAHLLRGLTVVELRRRGKQIALVASNGSSIVVHLGMTGQLLADPVLGGSHTHVLWGLDDGTRLAFRDPRRFGHLWSLPDLATLERFWSTLGPDALTISASDMRRRAGDSRRAIKAALLDQSVLAGVGNIYADEALFAAGIRPSRKASTLTVRHWDLLAEAVRGILAAAISARGSTLRDYRDAAGRPGTAQLLHRVYGRGGEPCVTCGKTLTCVTQGQRTTVFCRHCQR